MVKIYGKCYGRFQNFNPGKSMIFITPFVQLKGVLGKNEKGIGQIRNNFDSIALILPLSLGSLQKKRLKTLKC